MLGGMTQAGVASSAVAVTSVLLLMASSSLAGAIGPGFAVLDKVTIAVVLWR